MLGAARTGSPAPRTVARPQCAARHPHGQGSVRVVRPRSTPPDRTLHAQIDDADASRRPRSRRPRAPTAAGPLLRSVPHRHHRRGRSLDPPTPNPQPPGHPTGRPPTPTPATDPRPRRDTAAACVTASALPLARLPRPIGASDGDVHRTTTPGGPAPSARTVVAAPHRPTCTGSARPTAAPGGVPAMPSVKNGFETLGGVTALAVDGPLAIRKGFPFTEFIQQCWFISKVTVVPLDPHLDALRGHPRPARRVVLPARSAPSPTSARPWSLGIVRESAPVATALLIAGAGGSAMTADLGSRRIRSELDAMEVMGVDPIHRLVLPRLAAASLVAILLVSVVSVAGIAGGWVMAVPVQGGTSGAYFASFTELGYLPDFYSSLAKAADLRVPGRRHQLPLRLQRPRGPQGGRRRGQQGRGADLHRAVPREPHHDRPVLQPRAGQDLTAPAPHHPARPSAPDPRPRGARRWPPPALARAAWTAVSPPRPPGRCSPSPSSGTRSGSGARAWPAWATA